MSPPNADDRSAASRRPARRPGWIGPLAVLLAAYAVPLLLVPPTSPVPLVDDWVYRLSVERLVARGELWAAPPTVVTLLLQVVWGALFSLPFGVSAVALRASTLVASFGVALACYGLFRELGATRPRATLGAAAVWLNPLTFALSYTFMSDVPYLALLSAAAYATVRAARRGSLGGLAVASTVAGAAFLVRQQGVLVPLATVGWLLLARPAWFRAAPWRSVAAALGPCLAAVAAYAGWAAANGVPAKQQEFARLALEAGVPATITLVARIAAVGLFYLGLFVLPLLLGALGALPAAWREAGRVGRWAVVAGILVLAAWMVGFALVHAGRTFPFVPSYGVLHEDGLGPVGDVWYGQRAALFGRPVWVMLGFVCALATAGAALLLVARSRRGRAAERGDVTVAPAAPATLALAFGLGQFAGIVPPSLSIPGLITYDRYFLPLLPFALGLLLWALRSRRVVPAVVASALCVYGAVGVLGVQDWIAFKQGVWETADWLVEEQEVAARHVEGGLQWDAAHFYAASLADPADRAARRQGDPWWIALFAPQIDPVYAVTASPEPPPGYHLAARRPYRSWIRPREEAWLYVVARDGSPAVFRLDSLPPPPDPSAGRSG